MKLIAIELDDRDLPAPTPEIEQERRVAMFDLLEDNSFEVVALGADTPPPGPYRLHLAIRDRRLAMDLTTEDGAPAGGLHLSLSPFRQVIREYFQVCGAYFEAVKKLPPSKIEAIDMARRGIHMEGAGLLIERLDGKISVDIDTARRLFTLICVLHV